MRFRFLSPSGVIAVLALFVALGGSAFAAKNYILTSTHQIKPSVLKKLKGKKGAQGKQGPAGPAGPSVLSAITEVAGPKTVVFAKSAGSSIAICPAGSHAVSGGGSAITGQGNGLAASQMNVDHSGWFAVVGNTASITGSVQAVAYCSTAGQAVASSAESGPSQETIRQVKALEAKLEASLSR